MKEIKKMLVCVDLSEYSRKTIEYASTIAGSVINETLFFNVINIRDVNAVRTANRYYSGDISKNVHKYIEDMQANHYQQIQELVNNHFTINESEVDIAIQVGVPFEEILKILETEDIDLVVIGNKGRTNMNRTLFGSNAEKIFRHSPVPVLSFRDHDKSRESD